MKQVKGISFSIDNILKRVNKDVRISEQCPTEPLKRHPVKYITRCGTYVETHHAQNELIQNQLQENRHQTCLCIMEYRNPMRSASETVNKRKEYQKVPDKRKITALLLEHGNLTSRRIGHPYKSRAPPKRKPCRNTFTQTQVLQLEKLFEQTRYLSSAERLRMAKELNMTDNQLKTWYQNRRTKLKRELSEYYEQQRLKKYT